MAKKLDPLLIEILTKYDERVEDATWDCHGVWVVYHKAIERIAAKAQIVFEMPQIVEANGPARSVAICVRGIMGDRAEWSFGEASSMNCKNSYFYAMAEKRAKDRVVLKLIGLHGLAYSEEEADDFKPQPAKGRPTVDTKYGEVDADWQSEGPRASAASVKKAKTFEDFKMEIVECTSLVSLERFREEWRQVAVSAKWPDGILSAAKHLIEQQEAFILSEMSPDALADLPLDKTLNASLKMHPINAG